MTALQAHAKPVRDFIWIGRPAPPATTWQEDLKAVAKDHGVPVADITGKCRAKYLVRARQHAMDVLHKRGWSYAEVGRRLGGRDHSTVIHGIKKHYERTRAGRENVTSKTP